MNLSDSEADKSIQHCVKFDACLHNITSIE
jgi:hypothetical protein